MKTGFRFSTKDRVPSAASAVLALTTIRAFQARAAAADPERHRTLLVAGAVAVNIAVLITGYFGGLLAFQ